MRKHTVNNLGILLRIIAVVLVVIGVLVADQNTRTAVAERQLERAEASTLQITDEAN